MTPAEFRSDRSRCSHLQRILEMNTFKQAVEAAMQDMAYREASIINHTMDASPTLELRLLNQRKGVTEFLVALELMTKPEESAPPDPEPDYGAGEEMAKLANTGWVDA